MSIADRKYVYIRTFGCQMNEHDSAKMLLMLRRMGFDPTDEPEEAHLILYNTCTIREKAHHKAISEIGRSKLMKKKNPSTLIGVCGCVAEQDKESLLERYPHIDFIFGPDRIPELPNLILNAGNGDRPAALELIDDPDDYRFLDDVPTEGKASASAYVSIMKGCNCSCSYCIVPSVRGREVCRKPRDIVREIEQLTEIGVKEAILLGQNVNSYNSRKCAPGMPAVGFAELIRMIADRTEIRRIRFTSPHPKDVDDRLIREYAENEKLCPHIHLPLQAGSNEMLAAMRRGYTRERYMDIVRALRAARAGMSITTDIIVGFCGERREQFEQTMDLMRTVQFDSIFAFKYSPRPGTEAAGKFKDDVSEEEKEERLGRVLEFQGRISKEKNETLLGMEHEALVYGYDRMERGLLTGRFPDNRLIHFAGNRGLIGDIVFVRVKGANRNSLSGEIVR